MQCPYNFSFHPVIMSIQVTCSLDFFSLFQALCWFLRVNWLFRRHKYVKNWVNTLKYKLWLLQEEQVSKMTLWDFIKTVIKNYMCIQSMIDLVPPYKSGFSIRTGSWWTSLVAPFSILPPVVIKNSPQTYLKRMRNILSQNLSLWKAKIHS